MCHGETVCHQVGLSCSVVDTEVIGMQGKGPIQWVLHPIQLLQSTMICLEDEVAVKPIVPWDSMAHFMAKHSFPTIEYLVSWSSSLQIRKRTGRCSPSTSCRSTAPRPTSEASVCSIKGWEKSGLWGTDSLVMAFLRSLKDLTQSTFYLTLLGAEALVRSVWTAALLAKWGRNLLYQPTNPMKERTFFFVVGTGYEWMAFTFPTQDLTTLPRYTTCFQAKAHLPGLMVSPASLIRRRTCLRCATRSFQYKLKITTSSR